MPYAAVIGDPIDHSLSPLLHRAAYATAGIAWDYRKIRVAAEDLDAFIEAWDGDCRGLSVTMPHKHAVMAHLDHVDGLAKATGAVNTIVKQGGLLVGFNTDVYGIVEAVRRSGRQSCERCVIVGAGSTASSALAAACELGTRRPIILARRFDGPHRALAAAYRLGIDPVAVPLRDERRVQAALAEADLIVSTVPGGAAKPLAAHAISPTASILDVVYAPQPTPWQRRANECGADFVSGLDMLVHQAILQIQVMTAHSVDASVLYDALRRKDD